MLSLHTSLLLLSKLSIDLNPQVHVQKVSRALKGLEHEVRGVVVSCLQPWRKAKPWEVMKAGNVEGQRCYLHPALNVFWHWTSQKIKARHGTLFLG